MKPRYRKAIARMKPIEQGFDPAKARKAVVGLLKASKGVTLGKLRIKELIEAGRE